MQQPLVHVLVINWNGMDHLESCFDSLLAQTYGNVRFVLLDNASSDGSVDFVRDRYVSDPRVEIVECGQNLGWSRGNNVGIARALAARAQYVFLLNNDTATSPGAIARLVEFAEAHPKAGAIAPKMLLFDQPFLLNSIGIACSDIASAWDEGLGRLDGERWQAPREILGVCGGAMFLRADCLLAAGMLPEDFDIYLDDLDLCMRIWDAGFSCWSCPAATVRHKFSATMGQGARARQKYFLNTRNRLRLILRNYPANRLPLTLAKYVFSELRALARSALNREFWKLSAHLRSWLAALQYLPCALKHRRATYARGLGIGSFWPYMAHNASFFPGIEFPSEGWYAPKEISGRQFRPISARASMTLPSGRLRVVHANCYPHLGDTHVDFCQNGHVLGTLSTRSLDTCEFHVAGGVFEFVSRRVFYADNTGESIDIGGWVAYEILAG